MIKSNNITIITIKKYKMVSANRSLRRRGSSNSVTSATAANARNSSSNISIANGYDEEMENVPLDVGTFDSDRFDERTYLYSVLIKKQKIGEEALKSLLAHLIETKEKTGKHLKKSVFRHYNEFVGIAKEITQFETDMIAIKALMKDMQTSMNILNDELLDARRDAGN